MSDDTVHKEQAAKRLGMIAAITAIIRSHPDSGALKAAWADVSAQLGGGDMTISDQDYVGPDEQAPALLQREIQRWTAEIHRTKQG